MADSNDDLLEDGLSETNFEELDLDEEDALLADDGDETPLESNTNEGETVQEDDDYLDLGVDDDLILNDEEVLENGSTKEHEPEESRENDDSDEDSKKERARFKSERQIIPKRNTSAIPETLDAVTIRTPVILHNRGVRGGRGRGGTNNRKYNYNQQPKNIHVNPHFRPRPPMGGPPMWNGGFQGPPQPSFPQPPHPPPFGFQPPPMQPFFNGPQEQFFQPMPPHPYPQPLPPQPTMGWGDPNFYPNGPPQNFQPGPPPFQPGPGPQMMPPRMRPPGFNMGPRPPFNNNNQNLNFINVMPNNQQVNQQNWSVGRGQKRDQFHSVGKDPPAKQQRFENSVSRPRSNLQEVKMVDSLPAEALTEEEDEEMKAYRKKIEEQKKLRIKVLKQKEENRVVAAQQKLQETGAPVVSSDGPPGVTEDKCETKVVRVRTAGGKTIYKKMTLIEIKRLKRLPPPPKKSPPIKASDIPSSVVAVQNLSASTTQKQLEDLATQIGPIKKVELDSERKTAVIRFLQLDSAKEFVAKYQRKMVDLSMIVVKFVKEN